MPILFAELFYSEIRIIALILDLERRGYVDWWDVFEKKTLVYKNHKYREYNLSKILLFSAIYDSKAVVSSVCDAGWQFNDSTVECSILEFMFILKHVSPLG